MIPRGREKLAVNERDPSPIHQSAVSGFTHPHAEQRTCGACLRHCSSCNATGAASPLRDHAGVVAAGRHDRRGGSAMQSARPTPAEMALAR